MVSIPYKIGLHWAYRLYFTIYRSFFPNTFFPAVPLNHGRFRGTAGKVHYRVLGELFKKSFTPHITLNFLNMLRFLSQLNVAVALCSIRFGNKKL